MDFGPEDIGFERPTAEQRRRLTSLLHGWVETHPSPEGPALSLMGRDYAPREIVDEVEHGTQFGDYFTSLVFLAARRYDTPPEEFIERAIKANEDEEFT
jgi:hypothetical protein